MTWPWLCAALAALGLALVWLALLLTYRPGGTR
ncbi:hypothetical protein K701_25370 [Streptomyces fradiae ATCC 10745 = DSM 40063]|uniref:Uncharacterized protein n=1 Tax=Streptomyces fradiae ATCC 10745 = DSM 40063 TaxID=1319510 RepID=A0A1Y2NT84_STRFR|nr:hypothetical protein K701_25370 [Streptomyces fradiae ATCC 10745 = DSM 40063]OSY50451.1 hypothetical protein BG846_03929 [Streptomyces fradiae ATCC 10745 = DSM 40063]